METAGRLAGYAFIEVEYTITGEDADAAVVFKVREGPRVLLGEVSFAGNTFFTAAQLAPARRDWRHRAPYVEGDVRAGRQRTRAALPRARGSRGERSESRRSP